MTPIPMTPGEIVGFAGLLIFAAAFSVAVSVLQVRALHKAIASQNKFLADYAARPAQDLHSVGYAIQAAEDGPSSAIGEWEEGRA